MKELVLKCPQCGRSESDLQLIDEVPSRWPGSKSVVYRCKCGFEFIQTVFEQAPAPNSRSYDGHSR